MGFFAGLNDEKYDRQYTDRELTRRIIGYFKPQTKRLAAVTALVVVIAMIGAALPAVVSRMVDPLKGEPSLTAIILVGSAGRRHRLVGAKLGAAQSRRALGGRCCAGPPHPRLPRRGRA